MTFETAQQRIRKVRDSGATKLFLSRLNLVELPAELFELSHLTDVYLAQNKLTIMPPEFVRLRNLQELNLDGNQLTTLPPEIGQLDRLTTLYLNRNRLVKLPAEIGKLTGLRRLNLDANRSLTNLPDQIGQLTSLVFLLLHDNQLTYLPDEIGNLTNLQTLSLNNNALTRLPSTIGNLSQLRSLNLENNKLKRVPSEIGQLSNLSAIHLQGNQLTTLPSEIGQLAGLTSLHLEKNQLTALPREIGQLSRLKELSVQNNQLTSLPPEIGRLTNLESLKLDGNQLTVLPTEIGDLLNLKTLSLTNNQLTNLPESIAHFETLKTFLRDDQSSQLELNRTRDWDVFISHASEDKETVALPLARALVNAGLKIWIDQLELKLGDSIRNKIDIGLSKSRFGVVILSPSFINKTWTQRELNGLMAIEDQGEKVILPVWHNISKTALTQYSPILSDRLAANTSEGIPAVASKIIDVVLYQASASPSTRFPNLTRRFVQMIRDPGSTPTNLRDFMIGHPGIIWRALGIWGGQQSIRAELLGHFPGIFAKFENAEATIKGKTAFCLVFASPHASPLQGDTTLAVPDQECLVIQTSLLALREKGYWDVAVIIAGRRAELSESDKQRINDFNQANTGASLAIRTYDWLTDACVSLDEQGGNR